MPSALFRSKTSHSPALLGSLLALVATNWHCAAGSRAKEAKSVDPQLCEANKAALMQRLEQLPANQRSRPLHGPLPASTLESILGPGATLEIGSTQLWLNGELISTPADLTPAIENALAALPIAERRVYVAAAPATLIESLRSALRYVPRTYPSLLLYETPSAPEPPNSDPSESTPSASLSLPEQLASERNADRRLQLSEAAFERHARCPAVSQAVQSAHSLPPHQRYKHLLRAVSQALPDCQCNSLDGPPLAEILVAEQRVGAATLGAVPIDFLRDERCDASIPRYSAQWLLREMEEFDAEFSGEFRGEAMRFESVLDNGRLQRVLCPALPGETLVALQKKQRTLYWKLPGSGDSTDPQCQGWRFQGLEKGSPMGDWHPADIPTGTVAPPTIHYWQGAEEIRLYGPVHSQQSKATEPGPYACSQDLTMVDINDTSIELDRGRWFFSREACEASTAPSDWQVGCIADLALGKELAAPSTERSPAEHDDEDQSKGEPLVTPTSAAAAHPQSAH